MPPFLELRPWLGNCRVSGRFFRYAAVRQGGLLFFVGRLAGGPVDRWLSCGSLVLRHKKSPPQITRGGDRLKYHYDINIYEN